MSDEEKSYTTFYHHPSVQNIVKWFSYDHLDGEAQRISALFHEMAYDLLVLPGDKETADLRAGREELTVALRKLLEAKDAAVRCVIAWENEHE